MGHPTRKQYLVLEGRPILLHTLIVFESCPDIDEIVVVLPESDIKNFRESLLPEMNGKTPVRTVSGGRERQDSVFNGLDSLAKSTRIVVIHDGVRPMIRKNDITACIETARLKGACILGVPAYDTVKTVDKEGQVTRTLDRECIRMAQTPQAFAYDAILNAHRLAREKGFAGTDDASLLEWTGSPVAVLPGSRFNIKITTPEDLALARALMAAAYSS